MTLKQAQEPWYHEGLNFKCTGCGQCCTGAPGYVWVTEQDIIAMANYLNLSLDEFSNRYIRIVNGKYSLREVGLHNDCVFLENKKCRLYDVRPKQCRTFPFWPKLLKSKEEWEKAAKYCEGISKEAPLVTLSEISRQLQ